MFLFCKKVILFLLIQQLRKSPGKSWNFDESPEIILKLWCKKSEKKWKKVLGSPGILITFLVGTMQWMRCDRTHMHPRTPVFMNAIVTRAKVSLYDEFKNLFYSFPSILITNSLIVFFYKRSMRYPSVAFTCFCLLLFKRSKLKSIM